MIFRVPSYYNRFKCTADKCTDNCCIGWEIEIDEATKEYYESVGGDFGERLKENISADNTFILKNERCPFLNKNNLCDIIISCGENHLCQICRDHPRYFEWYGNIKEGGIGLSCEEGARLILSDCENCFCEGEIDEENEEVDGELFSLLYSAREEIFSVLGSDTPLADKLSYILDFAEKLQFTIDNPHLTEINITKQSAKGDLSGIISFYSDFEPIDDLWVKELSEIKKTKAVKVTLTPKAEKYMLNICRYFIWRYFMKGVFSEEILSKVKLAVVSAVFIFLMCGGSEDIAVWTEKSKLYSKQMEYSDENRELFYDYSYEKSCLETEAVADICSYLF
ncbi:MAG: flagellin lysine-N-methylase [Acutalibacteraceae bacterium]|nr:flagellin lysine-N-methylase [Acutalibacteraceae bacterium]